MNRSTTTSSSFQIRLAAALTFALALSGLASCALRSDLERPLAENPEEGDGTDAEAGVAGPIGWKELRIRSHYTDITIDASGHYGIERNNCWVGGGGALELEPWNRLVNVVNTWMERGDQKKRRCAKLGNDIRSFDGWLEVAEDPQPTRPPANYAEEGGDYFGGGGVRVASAESALTALDVPPSTPQPPAPPSNPPTQPSVPAPPAPPSTNPEPVNPPNLPPTMPTPTPPSPVNPFSPMPFPSPSPSPTIYWTKVLEAEYEGEGCTTWGTKEEALEVIQVLDQIIPMIFAEDCTMPPS